jgi:hypothetical protein
VKGHGHDIAGGSEGTRTKAVSIGNWFGGWMSVHGANQSQGQARERGGVSWRKRKTTVAYFDSSLPSTQAKIETASGPASPEKTPK